MKVIDKDRIIGLLADPCLSAQFPGTPAPFMGFENPDDLFFCISFFYVVAPSLFYDFMRLTFLLVRFLGSRSKPLSPEPQKTFH
jgi:hypothetical protein